MLNKPHASLFGHCIEMNKPSVRNKTIGCYIPRSRECIISLAECALPVPKSGGGVYANVEHVRDWIMATTKGCNDQTCLMEKKCLTKKGLHPQELEYLMAGRRRTA